MTSQLLDEFRLRRVVQRYVAMGLLIAAAFVMVGSAGDARHSIQGTVRDRSGPLAGATVRVKGTAQSVKTDAQGSFTLAVDGDGPWQITAAQSGYLIGGTKLSTPSQVTIRLQPHSDVDHKEYAWVDPRPNSAEPNRCGNCHSQIFAEWSRSTHSKSASNPRFRDVHEGTDFHGNENVGWNLRAEYPEGIGVCYPCHIPGKEPNAGNGTEAPLLDGVAKQGTHCDFCHKVVDVDVAKVGLNHGRFAFTLMRPRDGEKLFFGPLDDVDRGEDVFSQLYHRSQYCASCHEGTVFGTQAYTTYSEWLASPQSKADVQCQDCHMTPTGTMTNIAPGNGGIERAPQTLASHSFRGSDREFLRAHLSLEVDVNTIDDVCKVRTTVRTRDVGHSTPTGHPSRQLILWVRAIDSNGHEVELSEGPRLPKLAGEGAVSDGGLAGMAGRLYAKVLEGLDGSQPVPYWRPNRLAYDSRLPPDANDVQEFSFPSIAGGSIEAKLIYRRFSKHEADEKDWPGNEIEVFVVRKNTL